jgi:hypothetical protein
VVNKWNATLMPIKLIYNDKSPKEIDWEFSQFLAIISEKEKINNIMEAQIIKYNLSIVNNILPIYNLSELRAISMFKVAESPPSAKYIIVNITV